MFEFRCGGQKANTQMSVKARKGVEQSQKTYTLNPEP